MAIANSYFAEYQWNIARNHVLAGFPISRTEEGATRNRFPAERRAEPMIFNSYLEYSEEETLARVQTPVEELLVPINISLDEGADMDLKEGDLCSAALWSNDYEVEIFSSEDEYRQSGTQMAPVSMIPIGTFPANPEQDDFRQNAMILFTGFVREVERNPEPEDGAPFWKIRIETYGLVFDLYYFEDEPIEPGYLLHGRVWMYGRLHKSEER